MTPEPLPGADAPFENRSLFSDGPMTDPRPSTVPARRRPFLRRHLAALACALCATAAPAAGQVQGRVVDGSDDPIPNVRIEIWSADSLVAAEETDPQGVFRIGGVAAGPAVLTARRLGLRTRTMDVTSPATRVVVEMEPRPVSLAPVTVAAARPRDCNRTDDVHARFLWDRMRSRYWNPSMDSVFVTSFMELRTGVGERGDVHRPDAGRSRVAWTGGALITDRGLSLSGYAIPVSASVGERTAFWQYRALDGGVMQDFTSDHFGATHALTLAGTADGRTVIGFCPTDRLRDTGQIQGTLVLADDTTLASARWSFRTPRPGEDAGGEAAYFPPDAAFDGALLADETRFWRRTTGGRYYFEARNYTGWRRWGTGER
jgi:hypothetical protein